MNMSTFVTKGRVEIVSSIEEAEYPADNEGWDDDDKEAAADILDDPANKRDKGSPEDEATRDGELVSAETSRSE